MSYGRGGRPAANQPHDRYSLHVASHLSGTVRISPDHTPRRPDASVAPTCRAGVQPGGRPHMPGGWRG